MLSAEDRVLGCAALRSLPTAATRLIAVSRRFLRRETMRETMREKERERERERERREKEKEREKFVSKTSGS